MKSPKTFLLLSVIVAVLVLGVAYAALGDVNFNVNGTAASVGADASNFVVKFTNAEHTVSGNHITVATDYAAGTSATYNVSGMKEVGDHATVTFTISNESTDLDAVLSGLTTVVTGDVEADPYFKVTEAKLSDTTIDAEGTQTIVVEVELLRASVTGKEITIKTSFTATPQDR